MKKERTRTKWCAQLSHLLEGVRQSRPLSIFFIVVISMLWGNSVASAKDYDFTFSNGMIKAHAKHSGTEEPTDEREAKSNCNTEFPNMAQSMGGTYTIDRNVPYVNFSHQMFKSLPINGAWQTFNLIIVDPDGTEHVVANVSPERLTNDLQKINFYITEDSSPAEEYGVFNIYYIQKPTPQDLQNPTPQGSSDLVSSINFIPSAKYLKKTAGKTFKILIKKVFKFPKVTREYTVTMPIKNNWIASEVDNSGFISKDGVINMPYLKSFPNFNCLTSSHVLSGKTFDNLIGKSITGTKNFSNTADFTMKNLATNKEILNKSGVFMCNKYTLAYERFGDYSNGIECKIYTKDWAYGDVTNQGVDSYKKTFTVGWKFKETYTTTIPGLPYVDKSSVGIDFDQYAKKVTLKWTGKVGKNCTKTARYLIYRIKTDAKFNPVSGNTKWIYVDYKDAATTTSNTSVTNNYSIEDKSTDLEYGSYYVYAILAVDKNWKIQEDKPQISKEEMLEKLVMFSRTIIVSTEPQVAFSLEQEDAVRDAVQVRWKYQRIPNATGNVDFEVYRRIHTDNNTEPWAMVNSVKAPADPSGDTWVTYKDEEVIDICTHYDYYVSVVSNGSDKLKFQSNAVNNLSLREGTVMRELYASKGEYDGVVKLRWKAKQAGTDSTIYGIWRRYLRQSDNSEPDEFRQIASLNGTVSEYFYDDIKVDAGRYYEYKVIAYGKECDDTGVPAVSSELTAAGFGLAKGVISGNVTYGTGAAVDGVKVMVEPITTDGFGDLGRYSLRVGSATAGMCWVDSRKAVQQVFDKERPFTYQLMVMPRSNMDNAVIASFPQVGTLRLFADASVADGSLLKVMMSDPKGNRVDFKQAIKINEFSHITLTYYHGNVTLVVNGDVEHKTEGTLVNKWTPDQSDRATLCFATGGNGTNLYSSVLGANKSPNFTGNIADVRVWSKLLSDEEIASNYNHILSGEEKDLVLYWTFDEGVGTMAFDYSRKDGLSNGRHGVATDMSMKGDNVNVPTFDELGIYAMTDNQGIYTLRGLPFVGSGTSYKVVPSKGIHDFSPISQNCFIGGTALTINNVNYTDISSFPMRGKVYYQNTDIAVDSVYFSVDGNYCSTDRGYIMTGADGEFEISVPIGDHYVQAVRNGHILSRYPEHGLATFLGPEDRNFTDSTLVNVAGRIGAGVVNKDAPIGFGLQTSVIGQAELTLVIDDDTNGGRFNQVRNEFNQLVDGDTDIEVPYADKDVCESTPIAHDTKDALRLGKRADDKEATRKIVIKTDKKTGEFSAMLPPLKYKVQSIRFAGGDKNPLNSDKYFSENLPKIDATKVMEALLTDTLNEDTVYKSRARLVLNYRAKPDIDVWQGDWGDMMQANGIFGLDSLLFGNGEVTYLVERKPNGRYAFNYPVFKQGERAVVTIQTSESYANYDEDEDKPEISQQPTTDGTIHIENNFAADTKIAADNVTVNGMTYNRNDIIETSTIDVEPSEDGLVTYDWMVSTPNVAKGSEHTRTMSIAYRDEDGHDTMNKFVTHRADGTEEVKDYLEAIILGELTSGTNFVTEGPAKVTRVIRDPGGSGSSCSYTHDETVTDYDIHGGGFHIDNTISFYTSTGVESSIVNMAGAVAPGAVTMTGTVINSHAKVIADMGGYEKMTSKWTSTSYVTHPWSEKMETSSDKLFTGRDGDVYIGESYNLAYGNADKVDIRWDNDTKKAYLFTDNEPSMGVRFKTIFQYTESELKTYMIPHWEELRNSMFEHVSSYGTDYSNCPRQEGKAVAYTMWKPGDEEYGRSNTDPYWDTHPKRSQLDKNYPSYKYVNGLVGKNRLYADSIQVLNENVRLWKQHIANNECEKIDVKNNPEKYNRKNYSLSAGTSFTRTDKTTNVTQRTNNQEINVSVINTTEIDNRVIGAATVKTTWKGDNGVLYTHSGYYNETTTDTWTYTLKENDPLSAVSIDVYDSPTAGWGPIFITRGGQTKCPYQGESKVLYGRTNDPDGRPDVKPGTIIDEATMRIEKPDLAIVPSMISNAPNGGKAFVEIDMQNLSEIGESATYNLEMDPTSNKNGAALSIDGYSMTPGRNAVSFFLPAGSTKKTLTVEQVDLSKTDYTLNPTTGEDNSIRLRLKSDCDIYVCSEWKTLNVKFVPAAPEMAFEVNHTTMNGNMQGDKFTYSLYGLNRQSQNLKAVRLQYREKGTDEWMVMRGWKTSAYADDINVKDYDLLPDDDADFRHSERFSSDGIYEVRVQTETQYGELIHWNSEPMTLIQDTQAPRLLGTVTPAASTLTYDQHEGIVLKFNEDINPSSIKKESVSIVGYQNNITMEGSVPDVALMLSQKPYQTEVTLPLTNSNITMEGWIYKDATANGNLLAYGTLDKHMSMGTDENGNVVITVGNEEKKTNVKLPEDQWLYVTFAYDNDKQRVLMTYTGLNDKEPNHVLADADTKLENPFSARGNIIVGGDGTIGRISGLTVWSSLRDPSIAIAEKRIRKANYTPGIVGYWPMDEGYGTEVADLARSHMMKVDENAWYIGGQNIAAHLDGTGAMRMNMATVGTNEVESYAAEMWFRADNTVESNKNATLMNMTNMFSIGFDQGALKLKTFKNESLDHYNDLVDEEVELSTRSYIDGQWHHLALNVWRGQMAMVFVDGKVVKTFEEMMMPCLAADSLFIGGHRTKVLDGETTTGGHFTGDIDEVRLWKAQLTSAVIRERMNCRIDSTYGGLVLYYPMERTIINGSGADMEFDLSDLSKNGAERNLAITDDQKRFIVQAKSTPALKGVKKLLTMPVNYYDIVASDRELNIRLKESALPIMSGNSFTFGVERVYDVHGNACEPIAWKYNTDFSLVRWKDQTIQLKKHYDETLNVDLNAVSNAVTSEMYTISGMTPWIRLRSNIGNTPNTMEDFTIPMEIGNDVAVGNYSCYLYLTDRQGISSTLRIDLNVTGDAPDWTVDPSLYANNMSVTGQIYIGDAIVENTESMIAVFDGKGVCRGVANPRYVTKRDAYFVELVAYGNEDDENKNFTMRMYNASNGLVYSNVNIVTPENGIRSQVIEYTANRMMGSYNNPVKFEVSNDVTQNVNVGYGWNWMSLYVKPYSSGVNTIWSGCIDNVSLIKEKNGAMAQRNDDTKKFEGSLQNMSIGKMYKVKADGSASVNVIGITATSIEKATMSSGWNWIGSYSPYTLSLDEAFADLAPMEGDYIKSKTQYAYFDGEDWVGSLESIVPGVGYMYRSTRKNAREFRYPLTSHSSSRRAKKVVVAEGSDLYNSFDPGIYPDNMTVTAVVVDGSESIDNAELMAYIGTELRGIQRAIDGKYFLAIHGSSDDSQSKVKLVVDINEKQYEFSGLITFSCDKIIGSPSDPLVLDLQNADNATGIREVGIDETPDAVYTVSGIRIQSVGSGFNIVRKNGKIEKIFKK